MIYYSAADGVIPARSEAERVNVAATMRPDSLPFELLLRHQ